MSVQSTSRSVGVNAGMLVVEGERKVYRMYAIAIGITVMSSLDVDAQRTSVVSRYLPHAQIGLPHSQTGLLCNPG